METVPTFSPHNNMPTEIKNLTISDEGLPVVNKLLDAQNETRISAGYPAFTLDEFVQSEVNDHFRIHPEMLKSAAQQKLVNKLSALSLANLSAVEAAVDAEIGKVEPIVP